MTRRLSLTLSLKEAAALLGIGRTLAYQLAQQEEFPVPVLRIRSQYVVPYLPLTDFLGLSREEAMRFVLAA